MFFKLSFYYLNVINSKKYLIDFEKIVLKNCYFSSQKKTLKIQVFYIKILKIEVHLMNSKNIEHLNRFIIDKKKESNIRKSV